MKCGLKQFGLLMVLVSSSAHADSALRLSCADEDAGAVVSIDGNEIGKCPITSFMSQGSYQVRVSKPLSGGREQFFEQRVTLVDGQAQSIDVELSAPQLTAAAAQAQARSRAVATLNSAQQGDVKAMLAMAVLCDNGDGVEKSPADAEIWRKKAADIQQQVLRDKFTENLRLANAGDSSAMLAVMTAYNTGEGVAKDPAQVAIWQQKLATKSKQDQLDSVRFFGITRGYDYSNPKLLVSGITFAPTSIVLDLAASPSVTSEQVRIRSAAIMRPSSWAKPDSMMAKAAQRNEELVAQK